MKPIVFFVLSMVTILPTFSNYAGVSYVSELVFTSYSETSTPSFKLLLKEDKIYLEEGTASLYEINTALNNNYLEETSPGIFLLKKPLIVKQNASLYVNNIKELRLLPTVYLRILGKAEINGVNVTSWPTRGAYIVAEGYNSELKILNSNIRYLGFDEKEDYYRRPEERGLVYLNVIKGEVISPIFDGTGISVRGWPTFASNVTISNVTVRDSLLHGIDFDGNVSNSKIKNSRIIDSTLNGIQLNIYNTNNTPSNLEITDNSVINAGGVGIAVLNSVSYSNFENNYINHTDKEGFDIEGVNHLVFRNNSVTGAYWDGFLIRDAENITIENSESYKNGWGYGHGMTIWNSSRVYVINNSFYLNNKVGIVISRGGKDYLFKDNWISDNRRDFGFLIYNSSYGDVILENNKINQKYAFVFGAYSNPKTHRFWVKNIIIRKNDSEKNRIRFYTYNATVKIEYIINGSIDEKDI